MRCPCHAICQCSTRPTPQLVQNIRRYRPYVEAISSIRKPKMRHAVKTGTHITWSLNKSVAISKHHTLMEYRDTESTPTPQYV
jgi:hypothetical protein